MNRIARALQVVTILRNQQLLAEEANFHEFCRLLSRVKSNFQLGLSLSLFFTLVSGARRSLSLKLGTKTLPAAPLSSSSLLLSRLELSDTQVYEPYI